MLFNGNNIKLNERFAKLSWLHIGFICKYRTPNIDGLSSSWLLEEPKKHGCIRTIFRHTHYPSSSYICLLLLPVYRLNNCVFFLHHDPQHGYEKSDSLHPPYATQAPKKTNVSASNGTLVSQTWDDGAKAETKKWCHKNSSLPLKQHVTHLGSRCVKVIWIWPCPRTADRVIESSPCAIA